MAKYELFGNEIIDLTHEFDENLPTDGLPSPKHSFFSRIGENGRIHNLDSLEYCTHTGTHIDAPFHVCSKWPTLEEMDPAILIGPAVVVSFHIPEGSYGITAEDILTWEQENVHILPGDGVLLRTGHDKKWLLGKKAFISDGFPYLDKSCAEYLVQKKIRYVAIESIGVDTTTTESHKILLGNNIAIIENVCNLDKIPCIRCSTIGSFPAVRGASGGWIRLLALI